MDIAAAIIRKDGKFLIAKRCAGDFLGNLWEFPGGKREDGETLDECLKRELREELAIEIEIESFWKRVPFLYPDREVALHFYFCRVKSGTPRPMDCEEVRWVKAEELIYFDFPPADREIVHSLAQSMECENP